MTENSPLIVGFVSDLMFTMRIENVVRHLGYRLRWIESEAALSDDRTRPARQEGRGESLFGTQGRLFAELVDWQPALLIFDLTNEAIPWQKWIAALRSSPATRRIPVLCFGPHEDVARMEAAKNAGASVVLARSRFTAAMPQLIEQWAKIPDQTALQSTCAEPLAALAISGIEKFNQGDYYKCHDDLELAWQQDKSKGRDLYRGILQFGIAIYQIERGNYRGAIKMLLRVRQWLDPLPDTCRGVDVTSLRDNIAEAYQALSALGPENVSQFDTALVRPVRYEVDA